MSSHAPTQGRPSPEMIAQMKEDGVRAVFRQGMGWSLGPFILGYGFGLLMMGILLGQWWHWFKWAERERTYVRTIVYLALVASLASSVFAMTWFQHLLVDQYGTYAQFVDTTWFPWFAVIDVTVVVGCQAFNLDRAYRINQNSLWVIVGIAPSMLATVILVVGRKIVHSQMGVQQYTSAQIIKPWSLAFLASIVITDIALTFSIAWGLWRSKTGWEDTDALIKRLIVYTIETQMLPTIAAVANLIQYSLYTESLMVFLYILCHAKLYAVMMMAVLNHRLRLRRHQLHPSKSMTKSKRQSARVGWCISAVDEGEVTSHEIYALSPRSTKTHNNDSQVPLDPTAEPASFSAWHAEGPSAPSAPADATGLCPEGVAPSISVVSFVPYRQPQA